MMTDTPTSDNIQGELHKPGSIGSKKKKIKAGVKKEEVMDADFLEQDRIQKIGWTDEARASSLEARSRAAKHGATADKHDVAARKSGVSDKAAAAHEDASGEHAVAQHNYEIAAKHFDKGEMAQGARYATHAESVGEKANTKTAIAAKIKKGTDRIQKIGRRNNMQDQSMIQQMHDHSCALGANCSLDAEPDVLPSLDLVGQCDAVDKVARIAKVDDALGLVFGYAIVCNKNGKPYYDLNIDKAEDGTITRVPEHIPEDAMLKAAVDFMQTARPGNEMHEGPDVGTFVFAFPLTADIAKAFGIKTNTTGLMVAYKPSPEVFAKFKDGTYKGFSIEGRRLTAKMQEDDEENEEEE